MLVPPGSVNCRCYFIYRGNPRWQNHNTGFISTRTSEGCQTQREAVSRLAFGFSRHLTGCWKRALSSLQSSVLGYRENHLEFQSGSFAQNTYIPRNVYARKRDTYIFWLPNSGRLESHKVNKRIVRVSRFWDKDIKAARLWGSSSRAPIGPFDLERLLFHLRPRKLFAVPVINCRPLSVSKYPLCRTP